MDASFGIIFSDNRKKVLLVKRRDMPMWVLPGGKIEKNETQEQAVIREVFEETGFKVDIIKKIGEYFYPKKGKTRHIFECKIIGGCKTLTNESSAIEEFEIDKFPDITHPHVITYIGDVAKDTQQIIKRDLEDKDFKFFLKAIRHPWFMFKFFLRAIGLPWNT